MEKLKIAIALIGGNSTDKDLIRQVCDDTTMLELCSPTLCDEKEAYRRLGEEDVNALVLYPSTEAAKQPAHSVEIIATGKNYFLPLPKEPTAEDIAKFRDILERDFDRQLPRIAIVQESAMQNPDLASQVTTEQGINTYGPYTSEQILSRDIACHFDGIIIPEGSTLPTDMSGDASARFFAGLKAVITAAQQTTQNIEAEEGLADISALTKPIYMAIDIVRNRAFYDEARQNPLPKLFRDKREDRKKDDTTQANNNDDNTEKAS
jgi:hypothetical protein